MSRNQKRKPPYSTLIVMVACYVVLVLGMILATAPERYNLSVGDIATKTITATKDVVDEVTTAANRERAATAVQPVYQEDEAAVNLVLERLDAVFADFETIRQLGETLRTAPDYPGAFTRADLDLADELTEAITLSDWQLGILMKLSAPELSALYVNTVNAVTRAMESTIREGQMETAITNIQRQIIQFTSSDLCWNVAIPAVRACIVPNMIVNQEATEINRENARLEVDAAYYKSGQNIVIAGERVTSAQIAVLESLGLLEGNRFDVMMMIGVSVLGLLALLSLLFHALRFERELLSRLKNALIFAVIFMLTLALCLLTSQINAYFVPVAMVALLTAALLSPSLALTANILAVILVGVLTNTMSTTFTQQMLSIIVTGALSGPVGIYLVRRRPQLRSSMIVAGSVMAVFNLVGMLSIGLLTNNDLREIATNAIWSVGGVVLATMLCMGVQPLLEWLFNLLTPFKLIELSNPNQPLLRRLLVETPGTYHHSIMVANLAEAAAEAIGADPLLTRVGAYYHDIGKLKRPLYFKENQLGDNPHDRTDPRVSAAIITEHVSDGVLLARAEHIPEAVVSIIEQHHGDTPVAYFYHKMRNLDGGEEAKIEDFRYVGPKPQTREAAIIMLADTAEAAVRAGSEQTTEAMEKAIRALVKAKADDEQLNDSPLTYREVTSICDAFVQVLNGIYHKRIEYPKLEEIPNAALPPAEEAPSAEALPEEAPSAGAPSAGAPSEGAPSAGAPSAGAPSAGAPSETSEQEEAHDEA